jgi:hypothetical protein
MNLLISIFQSIDLGENQPKKQKDETVRWDRLKLIVLGDSGVGKSLLFDALVSHDGIAQKKRKYNVSLSLSLTFSLFLSLCPYFPHFLSEIF